MIRLHSCWEFEGKTIYCFKDVRGISYGDTYIVPKDDTKTLEEQIKMVENDIIMKDVLT